MRKKPLAHAGSALSAPSASATASEYLPITIRTAARLPNKVASVASTSVPFLYNASAAGMLRAANSVFARALISFTKAAVAASLSGDADRRSSWMLPKPAGG